MFETGLYSGNPSPGRSLILTLRGGDDLAGDGAELAESILVSHAGGAEDGLCVVDVTCKLENDGGIYNWAPQLG